MPALGQMVTEPTVHTRLSSLARSGLRAGGGGGEQQEAAG